jgi:pSer/pThr/pTyr-binding forkhead associated (FHA) protein
VIETAGDAIYLRDFNSRQGTWINGVQVHDAVLHSGDQIAFERNRFVVEAPSLPPRGEGLSNPPTYAPAMNITQTMKAIRVPESDAVAADSGDRAQRGSKNDIWWLIVAAALIAGGLALLFLIQV